MVLAAGRGERMRPLTDQVPKPLLAVRGKPLIVYHLEKLSRLGVKEVVINLARLGDLIRQALEDGAQWNLRIRYSDEGGQALETGGGIFRALPWLGTEPFMVVSADVFSDFDFGTMHIAPDALGHLALVPNPLYHPRGDFALEGSRVQEHGDPRWTYSGFGLLRPELFEGCVEGKFSLLPPFQRAITAGRLHGQLYFGPYHNVGTVDQLEALQSLP
jgi:N-acetyl-alpha-D-muramate 1-phosphate uridylyltransferase